MNPNLFQLDKFTLHNGKKSNFKMKRLIAATTSLCLFLIASTSHALPLVMRAQGTLTEDSTGQIWSGKVEDYGHCWHTTVLDLNQRTLTSDYADLPIPGCPDLPQLRHLPGQNIRHLSIDIVTDGGISGSYFRGRGCMSDFEMGQWALIPIPSSNDTAQVVIQGTRTEIDMWKCAK